MQLYNKIENKLIVNRHDLLFTLTKEKVMGLIIKYTKNIVFCTTKLYTKYFAENTFLKNSLLPRYTKEIQTIKVFNEAVKNFSKLDNLSSNSCFR